MNTLSKLLRTSLFTSGFAGLFCGLALFACDPGPKDIGSESDSDSSGMCEPGDQKPADDGCNTCTCDENGDWACTEIGCDPTEGTTGTTGSTSDPTMTGSGGMTTGSTSDPTDPTDPTSSTTNGFECEPGEMKPADDGCNTCECTDDGEWACTEIACPDAQPLLVCDDNMAMDPYSVDSAVIEGDVLKLMVSASGGCEMHLWGGCWDQSFAESEPVQAWVDISHDDLDDPCDAFVMDMVDISLVPMKESWQQAYQQQNGTITVHVAGWQQSLEYTF